MKNKDKHTTATVPSPMERARVRLKVCGMKYQGNISQVAKVGPDYLGFIFYEKSARNFNDNSIPQLPNTIKKIGVFVNADLDFILEKIRFHNLQAVQLHGNESPSFCSQLKSRFQRSLESQKDENHNTPEVSAQLEVIKVFSIKEEFNFEVLKPYENVCDFFLFDTKGKLPGGNGFTFDWNALNTYPSTKPFFLSGGIGIEQIENLKQFQQSTASKYCFAVDVNSKFEIEPGLKNIELLKEFKKSLSFRSQ